MRHKNQLPPNYQKLIEFILDDIGAVFQDKPSNIQPICQYMGWTSSQVHSILGILAKSGVLAWSRKDRTWTVVQTDQRVA